LVRRVIEVAPALTPKCFVQAVLAIIEVREDTLAKLALDTLVLLSVQDTKILVLVRDIRLVILVVPCLMNALSFNSAEECVLFFMHW